MTRVAIHQPDLLPWSGFWFKMLHSDVFVLAVHDQLQKHWVQRRVKMRETWVTLPIVGKPQLRPINTVEVAPEWQARLVDSIRGRYVGSRHWKTRGPELTELIGSVTSTNLAELNHDLILRMRDYLGIETEVVVQPAPTRAGLERVIEQCRAAGATSYLSGTGARGYIDAEGERRFAEEGIALQWSSHEPVTGDSILSVLMDYDDPLEVIARGGVA